MIKNPKGTDFPQGEEGDSEIEKVVTTTTTKASSSSVSVNANSTPWLRLKDPRIVRVSRVFGGKDRHSKVCTIRGLRDRRVRLSVPTAIQLYDLQDRLGLNQPSKVVDWLLNAAKHEIDELPPLPMPLPGSFSLLAAAAATTHRGEAILARANSSAATTSQLSNDHQDQGVLVKANSHDHDHHSSGIANVEWELGNSSGRLGRSSPSNFWSPNASYSNAALWRARSKEVVPARDHQTANENEKESLRGTRNNIDNEGGLIDQKEELGNIDLTLLQRTNTMNHHPLIFPGMINNMITNSIPASTNHRWEPPNFPLLMSHLGGGGGGMAEHNNHSHSLNVVSVQPSTLSLSTGSQFLFGLPTSSSTSSGTSSTTQTYMPNIGMEIHHDPRSQGMSHFQMLSSSLSVQSLLPTPAMRSLFHFTAANSTNDDNIGSPSQQGNKERE